jgi:hypothetical protein
MRVSYQASSATVALGLLLSILSTAFSVQLQVLCLKGICSQKLLSNFWFNVQSTWKVFFSCISPGIVECRRVNFMHQHLDIARLAFVNVTRCCLLLFDLETRVYHGRAICWGCG